MIESVAIRAPVANSYADDGSISVSVGGRCLSVMKLVEHAAQLGMRSDLCAVDDE
jgi:hypothetical protein